MTLPNTFIYSPFRNRTPKCIPNKTTQNAKAHNHRHNGVRTLNANEMHPSQSTHRSVLGLPDKEPLLGMMQKRDGPNKHIKIYVYMWHPLNTIYIYILSLHIIITRWIWCRLCFIFVHLLRTHLSVDGNAYRIRLFNWGWLILWAFSGLYVVWKIIYSVVHNVEYRLKRGLTLMMIYMRRCVQEADWLIFCYQFGIWYSWMIAS